MLQSNLFYPPPVCNYLKQFTTRSTIECTFNLNDLFKSTNFLLCTEKMLKKFSPTPFLFVCFSFYFKKEILLVRRRSGRRRKAKQRQKERQNGRILEGRSKEKKAEIPVLFQTSSVEIMDGSRWVNKLASERRSEDISW